MSITRAEETNMKAVSPEFIVYLPPYQDKYLFKKCKDGATLIYYDIKRLANWHMTAYIQYRNILFNIDYIFEYLSLCAALVANIGENALGCPKAGTANFNPPQIASL